MMRSTQQATLMKSQGASKIQHAAPSRGHSADGSVIRRRPEITLGRLAQDPESRCYQLGYN